MTELKWDLIDEHLLLHAVTDTMIISYPFPMHIILKSHFCLLQ
jgi:hypothetical protein